MKDEIKACSGRKVKGLKLPELFTGHTAVTVSDITADKWNLRLTPVSNGGHDEKAQ